MGCVMALKEGPRLRERCGFRHLESVFDVAASLLSGSEADEFRWTGVGGMRRVPRSTRAAGANAPFGTTCGERGTNFNPERSCADAALRRGGRAALGAARRANWEEVRKGDGVRAEAGGVWSEGRRAFSSFEVPPVKLVLTALHHESIFEASLKFRFRLTPGELTRDDVVFEVVFDVVRARNSVAGTEVGAEVVLGWKVAGKGGY